MQNLEVPKIKPRKCSSGRNLINAINSKSSEEGSTRAGSSARGASVQDHQLSSEEELIHIAIAGKDSE